MRWLKTFIVRCYLNNIGGVTVWNRSTAIGLQSRRTGARNLREFSIRFQRLVAFDFFYAWDLCPPQSSNGVHYTVMLTIFLIILKIVTVKLFALFL